MWNEGNFEVEISILQAEQWKISECAEAINLDGKVKTEWAVQAG